MALPQWNQVGVNFSGSGQSMANAIRNIGNVGALAGELVDDQRKAEQLKFEQERQAKADARADQLFQMQLDDRNERLLAKEAANKYAQNLAGATTTGIGLQDQIKLGTTIADLGDRALAAEAAGNTGLRDELIAEQQSYMNRVLPAMGKNSENPQAKLDLIAAINTGRTDLDKVLDPQTRMMFYREATQPFEKQIDRQLTHADRESEIKLQDRLAAARSLNEIAANINAKRGLMDFVDPVSGKVITGIELIKLPPVEQEKYQSVESFKDIAEARGKSTKGEGYINDRYVTPNGQTIQIVKGAPIPTGALPENEYFDRLQENRKLMSSINASVGGSDNPDDTMKIVNKMRGINMTEQAIQSALSAATGTPWFGNKTKYDTSMLQSVLDAETEKLNKNTKKTETVLPPPITAALEASYDKLVQIPDNEITVAQLEKRDKLKKLVEANRKIEAARKIEAERKAAIAEIRNKPAMQYTDADKTRELLLSNDISYGD